MSLDKADLFLYYWKLLAIGYPAPEREYSFDKSIGRKHRFDFCWPEAMIALEVNGNAWHTEGGGRHGQDADLEKMNIAQYMGYKVFQVSPAMLKDNAPRWIDMIKDELDKANL
jgi:very-short-patch-repair endonuclease